MRLRPLKPKDAACPKLLASAFGSLLMAPSTPGIAMQQWAQATTHLSVPKGLEKAQQEDPDNAPSGAVSMPDGIHGDVSVVMVDETARAVYTGKVRRHVVRKLSERGTFRPHNSVHT